MRAGRGEVGQGNVPQVLACDKKPVSDHQEAWHREPLKEESGLLVRTCVERLLEVAHGFSAAGETEDALHLQDWSRRSTRVGKQER